MTRNTKRALAVVMSLALAASGLAVNGSDASAAAKVKLSATKATIKVGAKKAVTIKGVKKANVKKLTLKSSSKAATVKKNSNVKFTVTGKKAGKATITATLKLKKAVAKKTKYTLKFKATVKADETPATEETVIVLSKLEETLKAVQAAGGGTVTLNTAEADKLVIAAADYSKVDLIVDAPNADVENAATFKSVTIKAIKANTWTEVAKGNSFIFNNTAPMRFVAAAGAEVESIRVLSDGATAGATIQVLGKVFTATFEGNAPASVEVGKDGSLNGANVGKGANVSFSGESTAPIAIKKEEGASVTVAPTLTGAVVTDTSANPSPAPTASAKASATPAATTKPGGGSGSGSIDEGNVVFNAGGIIGDGQFAVGSTAKLFLTGASYSDPAWSLSFQWYASSDEEVSNDDYLITGATSDYLVLPDLTAGETYYYVKVTASKGGISVSKYSDTGWVGVSTAVIAAPILGTDFEVGPGTETGSVKITNKKSAALEYQLRPKGASYTSLNEFTTLSGNASAEKTTLYGGSESIASGDTLFIRKQPGSGQGAEVYAYALASSDIKAAAATLTSIAVKTAPAKTTYTAGESFDPTGLVITKTMSDSTTADVSYASASSDFSFSPSTSAALATTDTSVTITYGGKNCTQGITVNPAGVTLTSIAVKTQPTTTTYIEGQNFDPTGLVITKTMSDSSEEDVSYASASSDFSFSPSTSTALTQSDNSVTITYGGKTCSQAITVAAKTLQSIVVKTAPSKVDYTSSDNTFDPTGLIITLTYDNGVTEDITYNVSTQDSFSFSPTTIDSSGDVTITYGGKTCTQAVTYS